MTQRQGTILEVSFADELDGQVPGGYPGGAGGGCLELTASRLIGAP
jgi:hypothetical protein